MCSFYLQLAFPCNAFGSQEPGSCTEIQHFAAEKFQATFPIFNKVEVNGPNTHPVFKFLKDHTPLGHGGGADIDWNFAKWVVNKKGYPVVRLYILDSLFLSLRTGGAVEVCGLCNDFLVAGTASAPCLSDSIDRAEVLTLA